MKPFSKNVRGMLCASLVVLLMAGVSGSWSSSRAQLKRVLVFTFDVVSAKQTVAENLTEKVFLEMTSYPGIKAAYIRHEAEYEDNRKAYGPSLKLALMCSDVECAGSMAQRMGFDFAIIGIIKRQGGGYMLGVKVVDTKTLSVVFKRKQTFRQGKREVIKALPVWGAKLAAKIAQPDFPQGFAAAKNGTASGPGMPAADGIGGGWQSDSFDPYTAHLAGTRISGTVQDTLRKSMSPYIVTGHLVVPPGTDWVVERGVTLYMGGEHTTITVLGKMFAQGTKEEPIRILSGREKPANWDWDRIFFQSRQRSILNHVQLSHSNYGVVVRNGAVTLSHCVFKNNSVRGVYAENSDLEIRDSKFTGGHLIAVQVGEYGDANIERTTFSKNHNAISVLDFGTLMLRHTKIEDNERGLILVDSVSVTLENSHVTENGVGVVSNNRLSAKMFDGLRNNERDIETVQKEKLANLIQKPARVVQRRKVKKDLKGVTAEKTKKRFIGGVTSLGKDLSSNIIGNVALGSEYHYPQAPINTSNRPIISGEDTIKIDDGVPQNKVIPGYYQTLSGFTTFELGRYVVDGNLDVRWDNWGGAQLDALSAKTKVGPTNLGVGDFNESGSEISISSLSLRGFKMGMDMMENRNGEARLSVSGVAGEAERPYDEGERVNGSYLERKQEGSAVAQKLGALVKMSAMVNNDWDLNFSYVYSTDKRDGFFRNALSQTSVTTQDPLLSQMVGVESKWRFLKDALSFSAELNVGTVDSTTQAYNLGIEKVLKNRNIGESEGALIVSILQPTSRESYIDSNIASALTPLFTDEDSVAFRTELEGEGLSGDALEETLNERLKSEREQILEELKLATENEEDAIQDSLDASKNMGFRWNEKGIAGRLGFELELGGAALDASYTYVGSDYYTGGNAFLVKDQRKYELSYSQELTKKISVTGDYNLYVENASSNGEYLNLFGVGEGSSLGFSPDKGFQEEQDTLDVSRPKFTHQMDLGVKYNVTPTIELNFKYGWKYKKELKSKDLDGDSATVLADAYFEPVDDNITSLIYNMYAIDRDRDRMEQYISDIQDETPLASLYHQREYTQNFGVKSKLRFSKWGNISIGGKWKWENDISKYNKIKLLNTYDLHDSTLQKLGYYADGEDEFWQDYDAAFTLKNKKMTNKISGKLGFKSKIKREEKKRSWSVKNNFKWKVIPRKLRITLSGQIKQKTTEEDVERYYFADEDGEQWLYYAQDGSPSSDKPNTEYYLASDTTHFLQRRESRDENEYNYEVKTRYNFNTRLYTEVLFKQEWFLRPQELEQEYTDISGKIECFYSF